MKINAVVLAGGRGSRMGGEDKGLLPLAGRRLVDWCVSALARQTPAPERVIISANRNQAAYQALGHDVVVDFIPGNLGPMAGIYSAMRLANDAECLLIVPCDVPFLPDDLVARMLAALGDAEAVVTVDESGQDHYTVSLVRMRAMASLETRLAQRHCKLGDWFKHLKAVQLNLDAALLVNINTPEELAQAEARLQEADAERIRVAQAAETARLVAEQAEVARQRAEAEAELAQAAEQARAEQDAQAQQVREAHKAREAAKSAASARRRPLTPPAAMQVEVAPAVSSAAVEELVGRAVEKAVDQMMAPAMGDLVQAAVARAVEEAVARVVPAQPQPVAEVPNQGLTHFNEAGAAHMVDVGRKLETLRIARASGLIRMQAETLEKIVEGNHKKGDVLGIARIAGIAAAKKTADLIPLCHPLPLTHLDLDLRIDIAHCGVRCEVTAETLGRTGVEMEALTAVNIALLTIYDMCKAVDRGMEITDIRLEEKQGGKSGHWVRA